MMDEGQNKVIDDLSAQETTDQRLERERGEDYFNDLGLVLSINRSMRVGFGLAIRLQLTNKSQAVFRKIRLEFIDEDGFLLTKPQVRDLRMLRVGETVDRINPVSLEPQRPGERSLVVKMEIGDRGDQSPVALKSYIVLEIGEEQQQGDRHYNINIQGPQIQVERGVGGEAHDNRFVGNDNRINAENRPEIIIHEAQLNKTKPAQEEPFLHYDLPLWLDYDRTVELLDKSCIEDSVGTWPRWIERTPSVAIDPLTQQRAIEGALVLEATSDDWHHRFILLMRPGLTVGRSRQNDYILRFAPYGDPRCNEQSKMINKTMGVFTFTDGRLSWQFLKERMDSPSCIDSQNIGSTEPIALKDQSSMLLAEGMTLNVISKCMSNAQTDEMNECRKLIERIPHRLFPPPDGRDFGLQATHTLNNLVVQRKTSPNGETLVWLFRMALIGRSSGNSLCLKAPGVESINARLVYHEGKILLREEGRAGNVWLEDNLLKPGEWALIRFGNRVRIGQMHLVFMPYDPQEHLDRAKKDANTKALR